MTAGSSILAPSCIRPEDPLPFRGRESRFDRLTPLTPSVTRPCPPLSSGPPLPPAAYVGDTTDIVQSAI